MLFIKKREEKLIKIFSISIILVLGFFLRIYLIDSIPSGFFCDEASIGYNAFTILTKGVDEFGKSFPIFFRALGDYKNPVEIYSTVPFVALFGLNEFSVRLASALFGIFSILAIYLLCKEMFRKSDGKYYIALFSAFFLAISPWHIQFSRVSLEGLTAFVFFTTIGTYFFLKARKNKNFLLLSVFLFILAIYSYFPARIFIPLFLLGLFVTFRKFLFKNIKFLFLSIFLFICFLSPLIYSMLFQSGLSRWQQVNIFTNPPHNENIFSHMINNYLSHFSPDFLFLTGASGMTNQFITRFSVNGIGELYSLQSVLIILALIYLWKKRQKQVFSILILWLLLYPVGTLFTADKIVQPTRSIIGVLPFQILSGLGLYYLLRLILKLKKPARALCVTILVLIIEFSFLNYFDLYFNQYAYYSSGYWGWQYGAKKIVNFFSQNEYKYDQLVMAPEFNSPGIFFKFYAPNNCSKCYVGLPDNYYNSSSKQLFAVTPSYLETYLLKQQMLKFENLETIYYPNGAVAFKLGKFIQK